VATVTQTQGDLCGNADMIYEVYDILQHEDVDPDRVHAVFYF